jgi:hypothetical protein
VGEPESKEIGGLLLSKNADQEEHAMDDAVHATHIAFHQRFDALKAQISQVHTLWLQAQDFARQHELIAQARALLAEVHTVLEEFRASWSRLHPEEGQSSMP